MSQPGKKGSKLGHQVPAAEFVLEAFGNSRTLFNPNASHFGKYTELQFTERGRICGVKTLDYYLERSRVSGAPSGERNFHIFYYLIAGASAEERGHMHLSDKTQYRYLGARAPTVGRGGPGENDDAVRFEQLKVALKNVGFSKRHVAQTCQLIAAILHLGNLEFTIDRHRNEDAAVVRNLDVLDVVSEFLGVQPAALEAALSYKTKLVKKELCTVFLDPDGASDNRDELAKTLYSLLFAWLNEHINQRLCRDDFTTFIGLFDLPGPQNMTSRPNSLDQFCVNFANERLLNFTQKRLFESHVQEYNNEGISRFVPQIAYFDNSECVRLLQHRPGGLIHIMDDQARRMPRKTDHTMVEAITKRWGNHSSFKSGGMDRSGFPTFTVSHYSGPVTYSAQGFLEKNLDALNPDFVSLLRGTSAGTTDAPAADGSGSMNPFVRGLFSAKAIATQAHPRNEDTIVSAQQPVKPMRAPSTRRKNTIKRMPTLKESGDVEEKDRDEEEPAASGGAPCVAGEFRSALDVLFETLEDTQSWYVFCINPNDSQLPNQMEGRSVKAQVRSVGLAEIARRNVNVFEAMMTPDEFTDRYRPLITSVGVSEGDSRSQVQQSQAALGLQERDIVLGMSMVRSSIVHGVRVGPEQYLRSSCPKRRSTVLKMTFVPRTPKSRSGIVCGTRKRRQVSTLAVLVTPTRPTRFPAPRTLPTLATLVTRLTPPVRPFHSLPMPLLSSVPTCTRIMTNGSPSAAKTMMVAARTPASVTTRRCLTSARNRTLPRATCSRTQTRRVSSTRRHWLARSRRARRRRSSRSRRRVAAGSCFAGSLPSGYRIGPSRTLAG